MISLERYIKEEDKEQLLKYYNITNINDWLFSSYNDDIVDEHLFYNKKYDNCFYDTPEYWFWQSMLYENLSKSLKAISPLMIKLISNIKGIESVKAKNDYILEIYYNKDFNKESDEFISLLNFANYFIQSKSENNLLPNPFYIEARISNEIENNYNYAYHITNTYAYEKIKKYGLKASDKTKFVNHDPRVYLWVNDNELTSYDILVYGRLSLRMWNLSISSKKHKLYNKINVDKDSIILKIDLAKFKSDHNKALRIFGDPAYNKKSAVYTLETIPSWYISTISEKELIKELGQ